MSVAPHEIADALRVEAEENGSTWVDRGELPMLLGVDANELRQPLAEALEQGIVQAGEGTTLRAADAEPAPAAPPADDEPAEEVTAETWAAEDAEPTEARGGGEPMYRAALVCELLFHPDDGEGDDEAVRDAHAAAAVAREALERAYPGLPVRVSVAAVQAYGSPRVIG